MTERPDELHAAGERSAPTALVGPGPGRHGRRPSVRQAGGLQLTFVPGELVPAAGEFRSWGVPDLARAAERLGLPPGEPAELPTVGVDGGALVARDVPARGAALLPTVRRLAAMPPGSDWPAWSRPAPSVLAWSVAAKLALETVAAGQLLPAFRAASMLDARVTPGDERGASEPTPGAGQASWRAAPPTDGRLERLAAALPVAAHAVRRGTDEPWSPEALLRAFLDAVADACAREGRRPVLDPRRRGPRQPWPRMWAAALTGSDPTVVHLRAPAEELAAEVDEWAAPVAGRDPGEAARLAVRLEPPPAGTARLEAPDGVWRLHFLLQSTQDPGARVTAAEVWGHGGSPVELAGARLEGADAQLVRGLATAARLFAPIDRSLSLEQPTGVDLDVDEAAEFLSEGAQALAAAGIVVHVPPELRDLDETRLRLRVRIGQDVPVSGRVRGIDEVSLRALTDARFEVALGDEAIEESELAEVVALEQPLVRWRGTWVRIDDAELDVLSELGGSTATLELTEALAAALSGQHRVADLGWVEATPDGRVAELVERLRASDAPGEAVITGIDGELRPYQKRAVAWLQRLAGLGMGGVLADEMGLGKTVQAIALLTSRPADRPSLVVCPTSVVGNWEREIRRFAPDLPVIRHHGPDRPDRRSAFRPGHVVLTSYALMRRDVAMLEDVAWDVVVLDEAQQIKNPSSKGARAARSLEARARIAMTGTPIENRLAELWSIVDVTNAGLLGSQRAFNERFGVPIERWHDDSAAARLRRLTAPFVLRRRKDDPDVSVDLPPKQEVTVACALTREQAALYQHAVDDAFSGGGLGATAFERRGRILALLTRLKQVCNHPAHYLRDGSRLGERSGKLSRATEILGEIVASGDRALVFTQFREMGHLLVAHLGPELELPEVPFLHGGVPAGRRDRMVERFQDDDDAPPLLVISLRAGGTGLNLTRATEVVHYDRWWNPAVEDQATDRVHRIGQSRPVTVHRLVTAGTVEDRIAALLERKRALADAVVGTGEAWITELDDDELAELVSLSTDDVADDTADDDTVPTRPHLVAVPDQ